jgi:hypothetical protein
MHRGEGMIGNELPGQRGNKGNKGGKSCYDL